MRFHASVFTAFGVSSIVNQASADDCGKICDEVPGLCLDKGSWCDEASGNCKNLYLTSDSDLCYLTPQNPCRDSKPVRCDKAKEDLQTKRMFDVAKEVIRNVPDDKRPRYELRMEMPPPEHMAGFCVIC
jgi:hypothetical protein